MPKFSDGASLVVYDELQWYKYSWMTESQKYWKVHNEIAIMKSFEKKSVIRGGFSD